MRRAWGVMQGRFTEKGGFYPQQFPWSNWEQEFDIAHRCGVDCIEWMFNGERYDENPMWTEQGRAAIRAAEERTGVTVRSMCANYFMDHALDGSGAPDVLARLVKAGEALGLDHIVLPLFGASEITDGARLRELFGVIGGLLSGRRIAVCIESDMPIDDQLSLCAGVAGNKVGICYDVGNAAGNGYDYVRDIKKADEMGALFEVHLKDKPYGGNSVMLGQGAVDFRSVFRALSGSGCLLVFESYFADAVEDTMKNIDYIRRIASDD